MAFVDQTYATEEVKQTFVDPIREAHNSISELVSRLESLTNQLCGNAPPTNTAAEGKAGLAAVPGGLFDDLSQRGYDMVRKIERINGLVHRIERSLP